MVSWIEDQKSIIVLLAFISIAVNNLLNYVFENYVISLYFLVLELFIQKGIFSIIFKIFFFRF